MTPAEKSAFAISLATKHVHKAALLTSAESCIEDAKRCAARGDHASAIRRAADSLAYSAGVFSDVYSTVTSLRT